MSRRFPIPIALALLALLSAGRSASSQERSAPVVYPDRVLVKLWEESGAVLDAGVLTSRSGADLTGVARVFASATAVERCVPQPLELLDRWYREADERLPAGRVRPGHLGLWFRLTCASDAAVAAVIARLETEPQVQRAERERIPFLAGVGGDAGGVGDDDDLPPVTPDLTYLQLYAENAPSGMGFSAARRIAGARGQRARMFHAENAWRDDHEDLGSIGAWSYVVPPFTTPVLQQIEHGTAVIGVWSAKRNGFGMTGVVDEADVRLVSWATTGSIASAITTATAEASPGDVLALIAIYNLAMVKFEDYVPAEYASLDFDAILTATTQGVIVVEAAGNGDNDLDDPRFALRFDRSNRDSGAILVGASDGALQQRAPFSNYGSRIDTNGWGYDVATLGYGTFLMLGGDLRQRYTERAAGTSGATALVSAVAGQLASAVRLQLGRPLLPDEARSLLWNHGSAVTGQIGLRPDVPAALASLGLPDGLDVDRHDLDIGTSVTVSLSGAVGGVSVVAAALDLAEIDLGLNRPLLLDPASLAVAGTLALPDGTASFPIAVPNVAALRDATLFLQALQVAPGGSALTLSSAAELYVR